VHTPAYPALHCCAASMFRVIPGSFREPSRRMRPTRRAGRQAVSHNLDAAGVMSMWNSIPRPRASRSRVVNVGSWSPASRRNRGLLHPQFSGQRLCDRPCSMR